MPYQVLFLNDDSSDTSDAIRTSLRTAAEDLGLNPDVDVVLLSESSWSNFDRRYPAAAVYFGFSSGSAATTRVLDDVLSAGITVLPLVSTLTRYRSAVPQALWDINGIEDVPADPECRCIVDLVLRELRLIRGKRSAFVSYKRADSSGVAEQLYRALDDRKYDVFLDTHSVEAGRRFQSVLWDRLGDADVLVLLNSPNAFTSTWVEQEVTRAQNLGLGVIQIVWPTQPLRLDMDLCVPIVLRTDSFDADGRLTEATLTDVLNQVEAIRARSFAARRSRVVGDLQAYAVAAGTTAYLQPNGTVDVQHGGRKIRVQPVVGHPESELIHDTHDSCASLGPDTVGAIIFDDLGLYPSKNAHLKWLNTYLPVRAVGVSELPAWLS